MTFNIIRNNSLGMGVILILTFSDGTQQTIPCHNAATAEYLVRYYKNS